MSEWVLRTGIKSQKSETDQLSKFGNRKLEQSFSTQLIFLGHSSSGNRAALVFSSEMLKLPDDLLQELSREAKARRVAKSVALRESLELALRPSPGRRAASCFDLARDLAGSLKGLPRDLARRVSGQVFSPLPHARSMPERLKRVEQFPDPSVSGVNAVGGNVFPNIVQVDVCIGSASALRT